MPLILIRLAGNSNSRRNWWFRENAKVPEVEPVDFAFHFPIRSGPARQAAASSKRKEDKAILTSSILQRLAMHPMSEGERQVRTETADGIVRRCQAGEREAFRELYDLFQEQVFTIALYYMNGDRAAAEDITQNLFVRLFSVIGQFRHSSTFTTWLFSLVANACKDEHRRRKRFRPWPSEQQAELRPSLDEDRVATHQAVHQALADLSPDLRMTVLLKHFEDLSYEEIGKILGCRMGTVASRLNRIHQILARKLSAFGSLVEADRG